MCLLGLFKNTYHQPLLISSFWLTTTQCTFKLQFWSYLTNCPFKRPVFLLSWSNNDISLQGFLCLAPPWNNTVSRRTRHQDVWSVSHGHFQSGNTESLSSTQTHLVFLHTGLGALAEVACLPRRVRVVRASLSASPLPGLPLQQTADGQCVVSAVTEATTGRLLGALLQCWHQVMDQLVHRPAKVPEMRDKGLYFLVRNMHGQL